MRRTAAPRNARPYRLVTHRARGRPQQILHGLHGLARQRTGRSVGDPDRRQVPGACAADHHRRTRGAMALPGEGYRPDRVRVMSFEGEDWRRQQSGRWSKNASATIAPTGLMSKSSSRTKVSRCGPRPTRCSPTPNARSGTCGPGEQVRSASGGDAALCRDRDGRFRRRHGGNRPRRESRLPPDPAVQADLGRGDVDHVNYNLPHFDKMWALIQECDLPITFHVSTGRSPRVTRATAAR